MNLDHLWRGAIISIESRDGRKQIWVHMRNQRFPLVNWGDLDEGMERAVPGWEGISLSLKGDSPTSHNN